MSSASAKVRSIYDALDARNPKQAVKLCDATLKKSPLPLVRALKAVALERLSAVNTRQKLPCSLADPQINPMNEKTNRIETL